MNWSPQPHWNSAISVTGTYNWSGNGALAVSADAPNYADYLYWFHFAESTMMPALVSEIMAGFGGVADNPDVELVHPYAFGRGRRHVPVVVGLEVHQHRLAARRVGDPAGRVPGQRQPGLEVGVGLERVGAVVEEFVLLDARGHQKVIESTLFQGTVRALLDCRQVRTI